MKASRLLIVGTFAALLPIAGAFAQSSTPAQADPPQPAEDSQQGATFESLDKDSDGRISKSEAAASVSVSQQFAKYDRNRNGYIERDEVNAANTSPSDDTSKQ